MAGTDDEVVVIGPTSPLVSAIVDDRIVGARGKGVPLTSAQRLQSNRVLVAEVLNRCFWAGLAHEEGRPVTSGVTFTAPDEQGMSDPLRLERPELLTVESLVRLGTVAGTTHRLAVHEQDGKPYIWGLLRGAGPPYWTTVWFDRPAVMRVVVEGGFVLGMLDHGRIFTPQGHVMANRWNVRSQLQTLLSALRAEVIDAFMYLANEMSRHGHGGALLIVPEALELTGHVDLKYPLHERSRALLKTLRQQVIPSPVPGFTATSEGLVVARSDLAQAAAQVASLTRIDGAVVVGFDLSVLGFGARITSDEPAPWSKWTLLRKTIYEKDFAEVSWAKLGGTRHQSAARFVATTRTSRAFVASHDGGLSALAWKDEPAPGHLEWLCGLEGLITPG